MSVTVHKPSGSKIAPFFQPVEILEIGYPGQPVEIIIHNGKLIVYDAYGNTVITGGVVQAKGLVVGAQSWAHNINFTASDADTVTWGEGTIYFGDGNSVDTGAGTTGNMAAKTYIYYNGTSTLVTTTIAAAVVGNTVRLVAIAENQASGKALVAVVNQTGNTIRGDNIVGGTISAGINLGVANVVLDGANKRILVNDGSNDRILIGFDSGGF